MQNVLIINGHQHYDGFAEGRLNQTLTDRASAQLRNLGYEVRTTLIESGYDIDQEIDKHEWADVVFIQTPTYWMSVPYLFKKYIDEVYTTALTKGRLAAHDGRIIDDPSKKYGTGGLLGGKKYLVSSTWNAPQEAFADPDQFFDGQDVDAVFMWLHKNFQFFGMEALPSFTCYDVLKNPQIDNDLRRFEQHLNQAFAPR